MPSPNTIKAAKIWTLLVCAAKNNQLLTYEAVGKSIGIIARNVSEPLGVIKRYCHAEGHYALTAIVVNKNTGFPGNGIDDVLNIEDVPEVTRLEKLAKEKMNVFSFNWMNSIPPTVEELERHLR